MHDKSCYAVSRNAIAVIYAQYTETFLDFSRKMQLRSHQQQQTRPLIKTMVWSWSNINYADLEYVAYGDDLSLRSIHIFVSGVLSIATRNFFAPSRPIGGFETRARRFILVSVTTHKSKTMEDGYSRISSCLEVPALSNATNNHIEIHVPAWLPYDCFSSQKLFIDRFFDLVQSGVHKYPFPERLSEQLSNQEAGRNALNEMGGFVGWYRHSVPIRYLSALRWERAVGHW